MHEDQGQHAEQTLGDVPLEDGDAGGQFAQASREGGTESHGQHRIQQILHLVGEVGAPHGPHQQTQTHEDGNVRHIATFLGRRILWTGYYYLSIFNQFNQFKFN